MPIDNSTSLSDQLLERYWGTDTPEILQECTDQELTLHVRECHDATRQAARVTLRAALDCGDALLEGMRRMNASVRQWTKWVKDDCRLNLRTAQLYAQLAKHRPEIEAAIGHTPELSLRRARDLISTPRSGKTTEQKPAEEPQQLEKPQQLDLNAYSDAEIRAALVAYTLERFLWVMPQDWRSKIQKSAGGQVISIMKQQHGDKRLGDLKARHLALAVDNVTDAPTTADNTTESPTKH